MFDVFEAPVSQCSCNMLWRLIVCSVLCVAVAEKSPFIGLSGKPPLWNATWTDHLKHDLLLNYDKFARPSQDLVTTVKMSLVIKHVEVDESKSMVTVNAWTKLAWTDEKLKWNKSDYGNLSKINVADHEIWQPDVVLLNSAQGNSIDHYGNTHCLLMSTGEVLWVPPSQFFIFCDINMRKWPFDTQECIMEFGSLTYQGDEISLQLDNNNNRAIQVELDPCEWEVTSANTLPVNLECCPETKDKLMYKLSLRRRTPAYNGLVFTPAVVCVILLLSVFWLPPSSSEKFLLTGATAIIITMFMIYFAQRLPAIAQHIPIIVEFYVYSLVLVCLSLVVSVFAANLNRHSKSRPVPRVVSRFLGSQFVSWLLLPTAKMPRMSDCSEQDSEELHERNLVSDMVQEIEPKPSLTNCVHDWTLLAMAVDRIMFLVYVFIFIFIFIILFAI